MAKVELNRGNMVEFSEIHCGTYFIYDNNLWLKVEDNKNYDIDNAFNFNYGHFEHFDDEVVEVIPTESITIKVG